MRSVFACSEGEGFDVGEKYRISRNLVRAGCARSEGLRGTDAGEQEAMDLRSHDNEIVAVALTQ